MVVKNAAYIILMFIAASCSPAAFAASWQLPIAVDDSNTIVSFEVDSTWHLVRGATRGVSGTVIQGSVADPLSIEASIVIPVRWFNTDSLSRDERMLEVLAAERFPSVSFRSTRLSESCSPVVLDLHGKCSGSLKGVLTIRDVSKDIELPVEIAKENNRYAISGGIQISWAEFNVEDPSILIARLDPTATISIQTTVPLKK